MENVGMDEWMKKIELFYLMAGLVRQDSGHWWSSFFFGKQNHPNGFESQQK